MKILKLIVSQWNNGNGAPFLGRRSLWGLVGAWPTPMCAANSPASVCPGNTLQVWQGTGCAAQGSWWWSLKQTWVSYPFLNVLPPQTVPLLSFVRLCVCISSIGYQTVHTSPTLPSLDPIKLCGFCFKLTLNLCCLGLFNLGKVLLPVSKNELLLGSKASCPSNSS